MQQIQGFASAVISAIETGRIQTKAQLQNLKMELSEKFGLSEMPTDPDILLIIKNPSAQLKQLLSIKPVRSLSGVAVVAVMTKPYPCPGKCIYCPSGLGVATPKSYTGHEPSTMRALRLNYNPNKIVVDRISQLQRTGHSTQKVELIVQGGTFLAMPISYQRYFIKSVLNGITGKKTKSLTKAKQFAEKSENRIIGLTIETRPDYCTNADINRMLNFGATRVELGVQTLSDENYVLTKRFNTIEQVADATQRLKDSAFKVCYHIMPGLPGISPEEDIANFRKLFDSPDFQPDMLKIYPTLVVPGTELYNLWRDGKYSPLTTDQAAEIISEFKRYIPKYVRVMRVNRDIPSTVIAAGVSNTNLREYVTRKLTQKSISCKCIRCREAGLRVTRENLTPNPEDIKILHEIYEASKGAEIFISAEDTKFDLLYGFIRLRIPYKPAMKQISSKTGLIRELHVYSKALPLHKAPGTTDFQHRGLGKQLFAEAEKVASEDFDLKKLVVISGLGVREYYRRQFGCYVEGPYMAKSL